MCVCVYARVHPEWQKNEDRQNVNKHEWCKAKVIQKWSQTTAGKWLKKEKQQQKSDLDKWIVKQMVWPPDCKLFVRLIRDIPKKIVGKVSKWKSTQTDKQNRKLRKINKYYTHTRVRKTAKDKQTKRPIKPKDGNWSKLRQVIPTNKSFPSTNELKLKF